MNSAREPSAASFEAALGRLQQIAATLEQEGLELHEALALFEEGVALLRQAEQVLGASELRVRQLLGEGEAARLEPFPPADA